MTVGIMDNSQIDRYVFVNKDVKNTIKFINEQKSDEKKSDKQEWIGK